MTDKIYYHKDFRNYAGNGKGECSRGIREFFKRNNLDYSDFLVNGISEKAMLETNDPVGIKVIEKMNRCID